MVPFVNWSEPLSVIGDMVIEQVAGSGVDEPQASRSSTPGFTTCVTFCCRLSPAATFTLSTASEEVLTPSPTLTPMVHVAVLLGAVNVTVAPVAVPLMLAVPLPPAPVQVGPEVMAHEAAR